MIFSDFLRTEWFHDLKLVASLIERRRVSVVDVQELNRSSDIEEWRRMSEADKDIIRAVLACDLDELEYDQEDGQILEVE